MLRSLFSIFITLNVFSVGYAATGALDLETLSQNFVLEARQLQIPGYPNACNPSIIRWNNELVLSFDAYIGRNDQPDAIGLCFLDNDFKLVSKPQILDVPTNLWQDPRLIIHKNQLCLVFNGAIAGDIRRMFITYVKYEDNRFLTSPPEALLHFPNEDSTRWERNWIPFINENELLLASNLEPHSILKPLFGTQRCDKVFATSFSSSWNWGKPKPGTTAHLDGDRYLAFFHSIKVLPTVHSEEKSIQHYFMGAYTFESKPPFAITAISKSPIVGKNFYHGPEYEMIKPCRVVFPGGLVMDDQFVWVVFGRQDHEVWMAKLDKKALYDSLVPTN